MDSLKERIMIEGCSVGSSIVKVDGFLNHMIDVSLIDEIGEEFSRRFAGKKVDKILTVESSGIAVACAASKYFGYVPVVFAKKSAPNTMIEDCYTAEAKSFTKGTTSILRVAALHIKQGESVLIIDDFLAHGEAAAALLEITEKAGAKVVGVGAVIEKGFQGGGDKLRRKGVAVESLAIIERIDNGRIYFSEQ